MTQTLEAIYQNGMFRPLGRSDLHLRDGQPVRITIETEAAETNILELAADVYEGLSDEEVDEVERIALDRTAFFADKEDS